MASRDVQDILGLSAEQSTPKPRPKKKARVTVPRPDGISREVYALLGERAPPVPLEDPKYKQRRTLPSVKVSWHRSRFVNQARKDGLILSHWYQKQEPLVATPVDSTSTLPLQNGESDTTQQPSTEPSGGIENGEAKQPLEAREYKFAKYNLQIEPPRYDASLYDQHLKSADWSREETEYLLDLHKDFYGKWPLITDRYDFKPVTAHHVETGTDPATQAAPPHRTMEDLKHRFYDVSARLMSAHTPMTNMSSAEFDLHEKLTKFNPKQETDRKRHKELIMGRSEEDKKEEEHLLAELRRIYLRQKRNEDERAELRDRLDHSMTDPPPDAPPYKSSTEINALFQKMLAKDKTQKQRRSMAEGGAGHGLAHAQGNAATPSGSAAVKRGSIAVSAGAGTPGAQRRQLSARDEARFGITHHDRLTSGVAFRSDRVAKVRQAKSQVQTQKIAAILSELQVPDLFQMPTNAVVAGMESLVSKVISLIEARKVKEKEENDLKIARERKKLREGGGDANTMDETANGEASNANAQDDVEMTEFGADFETTIVRDDEHEDEDEDAEGEEEEEEDQNGEEEGQDDGDDDNEDEADEGDETAIPAEVDDDDDDDDDDEDQEETFADAVDEQEQDDDEAADADENDPDAVSERQDSEEAAEEAADRSDAEEEDEDDVADKEDEEEDEEAEAGDDDQAVEPERGTRTRGTKRSASVLSGGSSVATKRTRAG